MLGLNTVEHLDNRLLGLLLLDLLDLLQAVGRAGRRASGARGHAKPRLTSVDIFLLHLLLRREEALLVDILDSRNLVVKSVHQRTVVADRVEDGLIILASEVGWERGRFNY